MGAQTACLLSSLLEESRRLLKLVPSSFDPACHCYYNFQDELLTLMHSGWALIVTKIEVPGREQVYCSDLLVTLRFAAAVLFASQARPSLTL